MTWEIGLVLLIIAVMFICLILEFARPVIIIGATVSVMMLLGILTPAEAVQGFSNIGMLTIALLFIIGGTVQKSELFSRFIRLILGTNRRISIVLTRLMVPVTVLSAFMNNTPIVTMLIGEIRQWCRSHGVKPSKLLMPLSYAAIFGGMITLIGTSTNLIVHGLMMDTGMGGLPIFMLAVVGLPAALVGCIYMLSIGHRLLPNRDTSESQNDSKEYLVEMVVEADSPIIGITIKQAKLRNLKGLYLFEIIRDGDKITPVSSVETIQANDKLIFTGQASSVIDLYQIPGLKHTVGKTLQLEELRNGNAGIVEAVVPSHSTLLNKSIKQNQFRGRFDAVVIAVHRKNERIKGKIGDIVLKPGDTLLLLSGQDFQERSQYTRDFYVLTSNESSARLTHGQSIFAIAMMVLMIGLATFNILSIFEAAILAVSALFASKCVTLEDARRFVHLDILILIACSLGIGYAVQKTGTASWVANSIIDLTGHQHVILLLIVMYLLTNIMTELITNTAAAVIMFPIAVETAAKLQVDPLAFILVITIAASAAFASPIGYQTHLLVYGPGGYRFADFLKVGIPLNFLYLIVTISVISVIFL